MVLHFICYLLLHTPFHPLQANDAGDYFPIWGTCQGFQQLSVLTANKNLLTLTDTKAVALPLTLAPGTPVCCFVLFYSLLQQSHVSKRPSIKTCWEMSG